MSKSFFYINGKILPEQEATLSVLDLGVVRGYGVFDYLRTYQGRPFHLQDHLLRLKYSAEHIGISLPISLSAIGDLVIELLQKNDFAESSVKILLTGGISPDQLLPQEKSSLAILVYPLKPFPKAHYTQGIKAITTSLNRSIPQSKTIQYIPAIIALRRGQNQQAQEALYLNQNQEILEATTSNFFGFNQGTLITPDSDEILLGITREVILKIAKAHFPIEMRSIPLRELSCFEEAFISSSNKEVLPVVRIDDQTIGAGQVGPNTKKLMELFQLYTEQSDWPLLSIPRYTDTQK